MYWLLQEDDQERDLIDDFKKFIPNDRLFLTNKRNILNGNIPTPYHNAYSVSYGSIPLMLQI